MHFTPRVMPAVAVLTLFATIGTAAEPAPPPRPAAVEWWLAVGHGGHRMLSKGGKEWGQHASWGSRSTTRTTSTWP